MCVVGAELFFLVVDVVAFVDFFAVGLAVVLVAGFALDVLTVFAGLLLAVFAEGLLAVRDVVLPAVLVVLLVGSAGAAEASMRIFVFVARVSARTCLTAFVCSSSVIRNS